MRFHSPAGFSTSRLPRKPRTSFQPGSRPPQLNRPELRLTALAPVADREDLVGIVASMPSQICVEAGQVLAVELEDRLARSDWGHIPGERRDLRSLTGHPQHGGGQADKQHAKSKTKPGSHDANSE